MQFKNITILEHNTRELTLYFLVSIITNTILEHKTREEPIYF